VSEPLSEAAGCALLTKLFRARGYSIRRNVAFREKGISFDIDGWDAKARVGFEFLSSEKDDHDDLSLQEFERLKDAEHRGELFIFVVDEVEPLSAAAFVSRRCGGRPKTTPCPGTAPCGHDEAGGTFGRRSAEAWREEDQRRESSEEGGEAGRGIGREGAPCDEVRPGQGRHKTPRRRGIAGRQPERPVNRGIAPA
jgi:hypothetical protein